MKRLLVFLILLLSSSAPAWAQIEPVSLPGYQFFDDNGAPLAGGKICTYSAGTTNFLPTYTDSTGTNQNADPLVLDSAGRATIWFGPFSYKVVVRTAGTDNTCATGSVVRTDDNIPGAGQGVVSNAFSAITAASNSHAGTFAASGNTWDFTAAAALKIAKSAGCAPTLSAQVCYDTTANAYTFGQNGSTVGFGLASPPCASNKFVNTPATATAVATCATPSITGSTCDSCTITNSTIATTDITGGTMSSTAITSPSIVTGIANSGTGFKHARLGATTCTTTFGPGGSCTQTLNWPGTAFSDTNYTPVCTLGPLGNGSGSGGNGEGFPFIGFVERATGSVDVIIISLSGASNAGDLYCEAVHD